MVYYPNKGRPLLYGVGEVQWMFILKRLMIMCKCNCYVSQSKHVCCILTELLHGIVH